MLEGRGQRGETAWVCKQRQEGHLRNEAVHLLIVLWIWRSRMITSSVGRDQARNGFMAGGANAKVPGHSVQLLVEVLEAVEDLGLIVINVGCSC